MDKELSMILLKDTSIIQKQAYRQNLLKAFVSFGNQTASGIALEEELDPKYVAIRMNRSLELEVVLSVYDKKKLTKSKSYGCKYHNGSFESHKGGWITSKTSCYVVSMEKEYSVEDKSRPKFSKIPWDTNNEYRLIMEDSKNSVLLGLYSNQEYDLDKIIYNLKHLQVSQKCFVPDMKPSLEKLKYYLPKLMKANLAEQFVSYVLDRVSESESFKQKSSLQHQSVIKENDVKAEKSLLELARPKMPRFSTIDSQFDLSSLGEDYQSSRLSSNQEASVLPFSRNASEHKIKSDFTKKGGVETAKAEKSRLIKSILKHPDQAGSNISNFYGETSTFKRRKSIRIADDDVSPEQGLKYESMFTIAPPKPTYKSELNQDVKQSTIKNEALVTEMSTVIAYHVKNIAYEQSQISPKVPDIKIPRPTDASNLSPTTLLSSPSSNSQEPRSLGRSSTRHLRSSRRHNCYFAKKGVNIYSTQIRESQVNSTYKQKSYFATDVGSFSKASMMAENKLVDAKRVFQINDGQMREEQRGLSEAFTLVSVQLPLNVDSESLVLEVYSFGMCIGNSSQIETQALDVRKILIKQINLQSRVKCMRPESNRNNVDLHETVVLPNGLTDFVELVLLYSKTRSVLGSLLLHHELFLKIIVSDIPYTASIQLKGDCVAINLAASDILSNRERKIKSCCDFTVRYVVNRAKNYKIPELLDHFIEVSIKQRKVDRLDVMLRTYLPPNVYLCLWLLITKKFKSKDKAENKEQENVVRFKSSILQSLYLSKQEASSVEVNNRVSLHFHKLVRDLERRAEIANSTIEISYGRIMDKYKGEYFKSSSNKFKIIDYIFTKIMCDYYNMFVDDALGAKNVVFSRNFRSCSRDYMLLHNFLNNHCENIVKLSNTTARDIVIWVIDHILSLNLGILREPLGYYHIHFLFIQSMKHKDDLTNNYGWRINLYLHVYILAELERLLTQRLNAYLEVNYSLEYLYHLVTDKENFYSKFQDAYLNFEPLVPKISNQASSSLQTFIKSISRDLEDSPLVKAERIYQQINANIDLRKIFEENVLENILVYQISRASEKPHRLINCVKTAKIESTRKVALMVHRVYNKDHEDDQIFFSVVCDGTEYEHRTENCFYITKTGPYAPAIHLRMRKVGDDLLFKNNDTIVGTTLIQLRRYKANVMQKVLVTITDPKTSKQYFVSLSVLVQEAEVAKAQLQFHQDNSHFKSLGALSYLLMADFKHPISNFEELIVNKVNKMYDELAMEIDDYMLHPKFYASTVTGAKIRDNLKEIGVDPRGFKMADKQEHKSMDSFSLTLKILLFKKNFELLEDYIIRYFGSDENSISASELVYTFQSLLKIIDLRWHQLEIVSYLERILKKPMSPKLESFSLFLGVGTHGLQAGAHLDLRRAMTELLSFLSFKKNCSGVAFGDCHELFLVKDMVVKMRMHKHVTDNNFLSIRYSVGEQIISETVPFDQDFKTAAQREVDSSQVELEEVLDSQRYTVDIAPLDFVRVSKAELRKIFTHVPLVEYLRFITQSIRN